MTRRFQIPFLRAVVLLVIGFMGLAAAQDFPTRLDRPNSDHGYFSVHYPEGFDPAESYHVLYWFHGTSGKPHPGVGAAHRAYVSVGMSYIKHDRVPADAYGQLHWEACQGARAELEAAGLKLRRDVVAGMSKGGWAGFYIAVGAKDGPDAVAIFGAGKDGRYGEPEPLSEEFSILIGTGETDPNYPQSQLAVDYFRKAGCSVNYEEWLGEGHVVKSSPGVVEWLEVEALKDRPAELGAHAGEVVREGLAKAVAAPDPLERYLILRHLMGHPARVFAPETMQEQLMTGGREAAAAPEIAEWLKSFGELRRLVGLEAEFFDSRSFDIPQLDQLAQHFQSLTSSVTEPALRARAAWATRRADKTFEMYSAQQAVYETPEYLALTARHLELRKIEAATGEAVELDVLKEIAAVEAEIRAARSKASMGAFKAVEWYGEAAPDPLLDGAVDADPGQPWGAFSGLGF